MKRFKAILTAILAVLPMIYTAITVFFIMPDTVAAHINIHGQVDRYGSKYEAFLLPAIILVMYIIIFFLRKFTMKSSIDDERTLRNLDIGDTVVMLLLVLLNAINVFVLFMMMKPKAVMNAESIATAIVAAIVGVIFILLGNIMPKTKPNAFLGMRLSFAMDTDEHWYIANRAGGIAMVLSGLVTVAAGLILRNVSYVLVMVIALIVFLTVAIIYSYVKIKGKK